MANEDPGTSTPATGAVSRRLMPFVPLAIALAAQGALLVAGNSGGGAADADSAAAAVCTDEIPTYQECHSEYATGCSPAGKYDAYLNLLKNQLISPAAVPQRFLAGADYATLEQGLPTDLSKDNHADQKDALAALGDGHVVGLVGYLYYARKGGKESSNCELTDLTDIDYHIGIGFDPALAAKLGAHAKLTSDEHAAVEQSSVIVEMTPHWRARYEPGWSLDVVQRAVGHQVRVVGQQVADNEHFDPKDDCAVQGASAKCWRASIWELHPVTRFEVCRTEGGACSATAGDWVALEDFGHAADDAGAATSVQPAAPAPPAASQSSTAAAAGPAPGS